MNNETAPLTDKEPLLAPSEFNAGLDPIEAETVKAPQTADFYIVMIRYGSDYWAAHTTHRELDDARKTGAGCLGTGQEAWRIVHVKGLPVGVPDREV